MLLFGRFRHKLQYKAFMASNTRVHPPAAAPICRYSPGRAACGRIGRVTLQGAARFAARPASQSRHPRAGSDGRTNPLRHRRLCTGSPSRAASHTRTAGSWDNSCPQPVSGAMVIRYLERTCADVDVTSGSLYPSAGQDSSVVRMTSNSHSNDGQF